MSLSLSRASPFIVITSREWRGPRETLNKRYFPEILMNGWRVVDEKTTDVPSYNTYFKHVNSKLWRQHTKAPLAAAFSPFMSLLYPPNPWSMHVNDVMWESWPQHRGLRPLLFSNSGVGSFTSHKNQISVSKCCETGSTVFHPNPSIAERQCNRSQMSLQRQHFLLSYLKTLSVGPAGVWTRDLPLSRPELSQLSQPGGGWSVYSGKLTENRQVVSFAWYSWWRICC